MEPASDPTGPPAPFLDYTARTKPSPVAVDWPAYPPGVFLNVLAVASAAACLARNTDMNADPVELVGVCFLWLVLFGIWAMKFERALRGRTLAPIPKKFWRRPRWAIVPLLAVVTPLSVVLDVPLRANFWINYPALHRLAESARDGRQPRSAVSRRPSYTVLLVQKSGPRVTLLISGVDGVGSSKGGFQTVADGSPPQYPSATEFLPMGGGWYMFRSN